MTMEIDAQDLLDAVTQQRDRLANENAQLRAFVAKLERELAERPAPQAPIVTNPEGKST